MTLYAPAGEGAFVPTTKCVVQIPSISARTGIGDRYLYSLQNNPLYLGYYIDELEYSSYVPDFVSMLHSFNKMADVNFTILTAILDFKCFFEISW